MKKLDKPIIAYLIIIVCSAAVSILMFKIGESLAEVTGNSETLAGLGFKASGSLGGFIIIFWLSQRVILKFSKEMVSNTKRNMKVYLIGNPEPFEIGEQYECNYTLFDENSGERIEGTSQQRWEAGHLTIDIQDVSVSELIQIQVKNNQQMLWQSDFFYSTAPKTEVTLIS